MPSYENLDKSQRENLEIGEVVEGLLGKGKYVTALHFVENLSEGNKETLYAGIAIGVSGQMHRGAEEQRKDREVDTITGDLATKLIDYCKAQAPKYFSNGEAGKSE